MPDIALDLNRTSPTYRDVKIVDGDLVLVDGKAEILQNILQTLGVYQGEWFMNLNLGIPYFQQILVNNPNQAVINAIFITSILNVPGVTQLLKYNFSPDTNTRILTVDFTVQTTSGIVDYRGLINQ